MCVCVCVRACIVSHQQSSCSLSAATELCVPPFWLTLVCPLASVQTRSSQPLTHFKAMEQKELLFISVLLMR